MLNLKYTSN